MVPCGTASRAMKKSTPRITRPKSAAPLASTPLDDLPPRRRAILGAAFDVLTEHGYAGASTLEIATRAKVSKRELYAEFGNKAGVLQALIATTAGRMQAPLALPEPADRAALAAILTQYGVTALTELTQHAALVINRLAIAEAGGNSELGRILERSGREPNRVALIHWFDRARSAGLLGSADPQIVSGEFFSLLLGDIPMRLMMGVIDPPGPAEIRRRATAAADAVLRLYPLPATGT
jgi:AcrR family transcriptional regulator